MSQYATRACKQTHPWMVRAVRSGLPLPKATEAEARDAAWRLRLYDGELWALYRWTDGEYVLQETFVPMPAGWAADTAPAPQDAP